MVLWCLAGDRGSLKGNVGIYMDCVFAEVYVYSNEFHLHNFFEFVSTHTLLKSLVDGLNYNAYYLSVSKTNKFRLRFAWLLTKRVNPSHYVRFGLALCTT